MVCDFRDILVDCFVRIREGVDEALDGCSRDDLNWRPDPQSNSIAWLVWHLTRIQDDHIAGVAGDEQVWITGGWAQRFDLPLDVSDHGYGHTAEQVGLVEVTTPELLRGYHAATFDATARFIKAQAQDDLDRIVDHRWDPPVTMAVRLVSVVADDLQHVGQAAYIRGLLARR
jgi:hypothetical protein